MIPVISEKIKSALIAALGLVAALFLGLVVGNGGYLQILAAGLAILGVAFWFGSGRLFWVIAVATSFLGGTFPILGGSFNTFQIMMMLGVAKFVLEDMVMRRTAVPKIARIDILLIAGFMGVLTWHGLQDRFGMRFLGSSVWGGRNYINAYVGLMAFWVVQSIPMETKRWDKLPYLVLAVISFDLLIAVVTTVFPSSIFVIYPFYSAVSTASIQELMTGTAEITGRIGAFGNFGFILILIVLASVSLRRVFHPSYWGRLLAIGLGSLSVLYSGYRSAVLNTVIGITMAGWRDVKFGVLILLAVLGTVLLGISALPLPKQVQRGLAFLPGNRMDEMARDAAASNDFRIQVWSLWTREYFPKHPILGRGFGFKSQWVQQDNDVNRAQDYRQMVEVGNIHNGFFATLDAVGILGAIFFIAWNIRLLFITLNIGFAREEAGFASRFLALYLGVTIVTFWIAAATLGTFLPGEFALAGVLLCLQRDRRPSTPQVTPPLREFRQASVVRV